MTGLGWICSHRPGVRKRPWDVPDRPDIPVIFNRELIIIMEWVAETVLIDRQTCQDKQAKDEEIPIPPSPYPFHLKLHCAVSSFSRCRASSMDFSTGFGSFSSSQTRG